MLLEAWKAPALHQVDVVELRSQAAWAFGSQLWPLAAALCSTHADPAYCRAELGTRIPCRASLAAAMRSDPLNSQVGQLATMMGIIVSAAMANVGGQGRRFIQARRKFRAGKGWHVYCKSLGGLLDHVEWAQLQRQIIEWDCATEKTRAQMDLKPNERRLDPARVTSVDHRAPFFFDKSIRDLSLFLNLRGSDSYVAVVPTDGSAFKWDFSSMYALMKEISLNPPHTSRIYAVQRKGIKLPPPFINLVAPLRQPPEPLKPWWATALRLFRDFSVGACTTRQVSAHLETGLAHSCSKQCVAHPIWVGWLLKNSLCWSALGKGRDQNFHGPISLFRGTEKPQGP